MAHQLEARHLGQALLALLLEGVPVDVSRQRQSLAFGRPAAEPGEAVGHATVGEAWHRQISIPATNLTLQGIEAQPPGIGPLAMPAHMARCGHGLLHRHGQVLAGERQAVRGDQLAPLLREGPIVGVGGAVIAAGRQAHGAAPLGGQLDQPFVQVAAGMQGRHLGVCRQPAGGIGGQHVLLRQLHPGPLSLGQRLAIAAERGLPLQAGNIALEVAGQGPGQMALARTPLHQPDVRQRRHAGDEGRHLLPFTPPHVFGPRCRQARALGRQLG